MSYRLLIPQDRFQMWGPSVQDGVTGTVTISVSVVGGRVSLTTYNTCETLQYLDMKLYSTCETLQYLTRVNSTFGRTNLSYV